MKLVTAVWLVVVVMLAWPGGLTAHHSLVRFDTTAPVWIKGTVVRFDLVNPHAKIVLTQKRDDGQTQRWIVDGPPLNNLARMGIGQDFVKAGDVVEVCGFLQKEEAPNMMPDRPISGHLLVLPGGKRQFWSDYGVLHKCLGPGEDVEALRREAFGR